MKYRKHLSTLVLTLLASSAFGGTRTPLNNAYLQTNLDGNKQAITNLQSLTVSNLTAQNIEGLTTNVMQAGTGVLVATNTPGSDYTVSADTSLMATRSYADGSASTAAAAAATAATNPIPAQMTNIANAAIAAVSNQFVLSLTAVVNAELTSTNFVDGILFGRNFTTNSLRGGVVTGIGNKVLTIDGFGRTLQSPVSMRLPRACSNLTLVVSYRFSRFAGQGGITVALANTNTGSSVEFYDNNGGLIQPWENYRGKFWSDRSDGTFVSLFMPLWMNNYNYQMWDGLHDQPRVLSFVRDTTATWRVYFNSVPGKIGFSVPTFTWQSPTNASDVFDMLYVGTSGVTNAASATNVQVSSVFVFDTTNYSATVAGYKAALSAIDTDTVDLWLGDSLLAGRSTFDDAPSFWWQKHPSDFQMNWAQGGTRTYQMRDVFITDGGIAAITNTPSKIKNKNVFFGSGINDFYGDNLSADTVWGSSTNILWVCKNAGAKVWFIDVAQIATNSVAYPYDLAKETNAFLLNKMFRTNPYAPFNTYVSRRDFCSQALLETNGAFSTDGVHLDGRTNCAYNRALADLIDANVPFSITNGVVIP